MGCSGTGTLQYSGSTNCSTGPLAALVSALPPSLPPPFPPCRLMWVELLLPAHRPSLANDAATARPSLLPPIPRGSRSQCRARPTWSRRWSSRFT